MMPRPGGSDPPPPSVSAGATPFDRVNNLGRSVVRSAHVRRRVLRRGCEHNAAAEVLGTLERGVDLVAVSAGRFTLTGVLAHVLATTGPSEVWVCVPGVAAADLGTVHQLSQAGGVRGLRLLVDFQVAARQRPLVELVHQTFGPDVLRVGMVHAGFAVIRNDTWNVCVRTSAGLSACHRLELFEVTDSAELADFLVEVFTLVSDVAPGHEAGRLEHNAAHDRAFPRATSKPAPVGGAADVSKAGVSYR